jgi:hypothetical protein
MKYVFVLLILCAACTKHEEAKPVPVTPPPAPKAVTKVAENPKSQQDRELQKIARWFEQMDSILRESLWVVRKDRPPLGKSIFGKMRRAILVELKEKLSNKSLFRCDIYSMTRNTPGLSGIPQSAEVMHKCGSRDSFNKIGDWNHPSAKVLTMGFRGGNLEDVLGMATGILSPRISCELKANDNDNIEHLKCEDLMIDYNAKKGQVLKFTRFEYDRGATQILHLNAEILENLQPVRKIEADVPIDGAIQVTETVLSEPMVEAKPLPPTPPNPSPDAKRPNKENPNGQEDPPQPILPDPQQSQVPPGAEEGQADSGEVQDPQKPKAPGRRARPAVTVQPVDIQPVEANQQAEDERRRKQEQEILQRQQQQQPEQPQQQHGVPQFQPGAEGQPSPR